MSNLKRLPGATDSNTAEIRKSGLLFCHAQLVSHRVRSLARQSTSRIRGSRKERARIGSPSSAAQPPSLFPACIYCGPVLLPVATPCNRRPFRNPCLLEPSLHASLSARGIACHDQLSHPLPICVKVWRETFTVNERMNQLVLEHLDPRAWRAQPPNPRGRTIAAIFTHVHNVRCKWLRLSAPHLKPPPQLNRARCTQNEAAKATARSAALCSQMLAEALAPQGGVRRVSPRQLGQTVAHRCGHVRLHDRA